METQKIVVEVCEKVLTSLAETHQKEAQNIRLRIDVETIKSKPVFGVFDQKIFIGHLTLNEVIAHGGGKGMGLIIGMYLKNIIRDLFLGFTKHLNENNTKNIFIILHFKTIGEINQPVLSIYHLGKLVDSIAVGEIIDLQNQQK